MMRWLLMLKENFELNEKYQFYEIRIKVPQQLKSEKTIALVEKVIQRYATQVHNIA